MSLSERDRADLKKAAEAVAQLASSCGKDLTAIEVNLWLREIARYGAGLTLAFVEFWASGGGQERFRRAPFIEDFKRRVDPNYISADDALDRLRQLVQACGPYASPQIEDQRLRQAIEILGGWPKVCGELPDASDDFGTRRYAERFAGVWVQAEGRVMRGESSTRPVLGLASQRFLVESEASTALTTLKI